MLTLTPQQIQRYKQIRSLEQLQQMTPADFKHYCVWLYQKEGYTLEKTAESHHEGFDLLFSKQGQWVVVRCLQHAGDVGRSVVQNLYGGMLNAAASEAHLCTTGRMADAAKHWAAGKPLELIDGEDMVTWGNKWHRLDKSNSDDAQPAAQSMLPSATTATMWIAGFVVLAMLALIVGGWVFFGRRTARPEPTAVLNIPALPSATPRPGENVGDEGELPTAIAVSDPTEESEEEQETPETTAVPVATATFGIQETAEPPTPPPAAVNVNVPKRPTSFQIDGSLDDWDAVDLAASSDALVYAVDDWDGSKDLEASWYLAWDEQALYVSVFVIDDVHAQYSTGSNIFRGDSLEIQLDTDRDGDFGSGISADEFQLEISPGNFADIAPEAWRFAGRNNGTYVDAPGHQIQVAAQPSDYGYLIEVRIPWSDINVTPTQGLVLGANLNVNDNDDEGPLQEVMMSNVPTRSYRDPTTWGTLTLR